MTGDGRGSGPHIKVTIDQVVVTGLGSADARQRRTFAGHAPGRPVRRPGDAAPGR